MEKSLYRITKEYASIIDEILENEGVIMPEQETALALCQEELPQKAESYAAIDNRLDAEITWIDNEIKRLTAAKKARVTLKESLRNRLANAMQLFGVDELKTALNKISFRKSESVVFDVEPEELPKKLQKIKIEAISKTEIKAMIKAGETFKGVRLVENRNIQIK